MIRERSFIQSKSDRGIATYLALLIAASGSIVEITAYETELTTRAIQGAKMGDG